MPITASTIIEDSPQRDRRRHVRERHVDHTAVAHEVTYMAGAGTDVQAVMTARVSQIEARLTARELTANEVIVLNATGESIRFVHSTRNDFIQRIRDLFRVVIALEAANLAAYLLTLTDAQLRMIFNMTQEQVDELKTRLQAKVDRRDALHAEAGE